MTNMTAVDYLIEQYKTKGYIGLQDELQAKEYEKHQTIDFATDFAKDYIGFDSVSSDPNDPGPAAHYYNQKFKK